MSPRVAKKDKGALPKTEVALETLAFYGADQYTLSLLGQERCTAVIGIKEAKLSEVLKTAPNIQLQSQAVDIKGRFYNGLSDAFYRGVFPHVLLVSGDFVQLDAFMDDMLDHIEKMVGLGFFFQYPNPAEALIPNVVIACNGIYFHPLQKKLSLMMDGLKTLDQETKNAIFAKFMRGILSDYSVIAPYQSGAKVSLLTPSVIKLAGGSRTNRNTVQEALEAHHLPVIIAPPHNQVIDALELENALKRVIQVILPGLNAAKALDTKTTAKLTKALQNAILDIGQHRQSFHDQYGFDFLEDEPQVTDVKVTFGDLSIVRALAHYAKDAGFNESATQFDQLAKHLQTLLNS